MKNSFGKTSLLFLALMLTIQSVNCAYAQQKKDKNNNPQSVGATPNRIIKTIPVEIPYYNQILMQARLNNSEPMWFLFDTGASWTILDVDKAKELNIKTDDDTTLDLGQTNTVKTSFAKNANLEISGVNVPVETLAVMRAKFRHAPQVVGLIGSEVFKKFVVEIDYAAKTVNLFEPKNYQYNGKGEILPMKLIGDTPHITVEINKENVGALKANMMIDTGASQTVMFYAPFVEKNKLLDPTAEKLKTGSGGLGGGGSNILSRLKTFKIGKVTFDNPLTNFFQWSGHADYRDGLIGNGILNRFKMIVDYSRNQIILEPTEKVNIPTDFDFFGLEITAAENGFRINDVYKGLRAEQAGLKTGDVLLEIDGKSLSKLSLSEVSKMFMLDGRERILKVKRNAEILQIKLSPPKVE